METFSDANAAIKICQVREAVRDKFTEAGWDTRSNSPTRDEPPTLEELLTFLDSTIDVLDTFEPAVGKIPWKSATMVDIYHVLQGIDRV